mmetsp:Transcript_152525/g.489156  ORF Transcript_152525/g.489156 Transcript_152525/m.489156 type:complete len:99 (+) Transcript_152525:1629-1925(+)
MRVERLLHLSARTSFVSLAQRMAGIAWQPVHTVKSGQPGHALRFPSPTLPVTMCPMQATIRGLESQFTRLCLRRSSGCSRKWFKHFHQATPDTWGFEA